MGKISLCCCICALTHTECDTCKCREIAVIVDGVSVSSQKKEGERNREKKQDGERNRRGKIEKS